MLYKCLNYDYECKCTPHILPCNGIVFIYICICCRLFVFQVEHLRIYYLLAFWFYASKLVGHLFYHIHVHTVLLTTNHHYRHMHISIVCFRLAIYTPFSLILISNRQWGKKGGQRAMMLVIKFTFMYADIQIKTNAPTPTQHMYIAGFAPSAHTHRENTHNQTDSTIQWCVGRCMNFILELSDSNEQHNDRYLLQSKIIIISFNICVCKLLQCFK